MKLKLSSLTLLLIIVKLVSGWNERDEFTCPTLYDAGPNASVIDMCACKDVEGFVTCLHDSQQVCLSEGICMTYSNDSGQVEIGKCPYAIFDGRYPGLQ